MPWTGVAATGAPVRGICLVTGRRGSLARAGGARLALVVSACSGEKGPGTAAPPVGRREPAPVRIATVAEQSMPVQLTGFGVVEAYATISVKAQVSGEITKVWFHEGDLVNEDQTLFTIDPRPYEVALQQAEANLAKAEAQLEQSRANMARSRAQANNTKVVLERDSTLVTKGMVSPEEFDQTRTNAEALEAAAKADEASVRSATESIRSAKAAIEEAKLQLDYCTIRSPINGKTGDLLIDRGNVVTPNDTNPLVTINQLTPIYVAFPAPERYLAEIKDYMAKGPLEVKAMPVPESESSIGTLVFVDNMVDRNTGTIRLKATFNNEDHRLWPGQFVEVVVQMAVQANAIVVPSQAVQEGQEGTYAYVVRLEDMTAELRKVTAGNTVAGLTVIKEGLQPEETVVTDGQLRLRPGAPVKIIDATSEGGPAA